MIQRLFLEEGQVEFVGHQRFGDMLRQSQVAFRRRIVARTAALVRGFVAIIHTQRKRGVVVEEKGCHMIVEDHEQHIDLLRLHPVLDFAETVENGCPGRVLGLVGVLCESDGGRVGCAYAANDLSHA